MGMKIKQWLQSLSFRTGVIVLMCCIPFYILSFAQMLLPISTTAKGVLWAVLFGLAKFVRFAKNVWDIKGEGMTDEQIAEAGLEAKQHGC